MLNENTDPRSEKLTKFRKINCWWDIDWKNARREHYFYCDGDKVKIERWMSTNKRIPSWKLCSKNKKQWMKKKLKYEHWYSVYRDYDYYKITW